MKGIVFKQFSLGWDIEIREFWSGTGYHLPGNRSVVLSIKSRIEIETMKRKSLVFNERK